EPFRARPRRPAPIHDRMPPRGPALGCRTGVALRRRYRRQAAREIPHRRYACPHFLSFLPFFFPLPPFLAIGLLLSPPRREACAARSRPPPAKTGGGVSSSLAGLLELLLLGKWPPRVPVFQR